MLSFSVWYHVPSGGRGMSLLVWSHPKGWVCSQGRGGFPLRGRESVEGRVLLPCKGASLEFPSATGLQTNIPEGQEHTVSTRRSLMIACQYQKAKLASRLEP